jgi:hypothetical protein
MSDGDTVASCHQQLAAAEQNAFERATVAIAAVQL